MILTREKSIELCIKLWEWLAKMGKEKDEWPQWALYDDVMSLCWFCEYSSQQNKKHIYDGICESCPITSIARDCMQTFYSEWTREATVAGRKKYARLFLKQLKTIK